MAKNYLIPSTGVSQIAHEFLEEKEHCQVDFNVSLNGVSDTPLKLICPINNPYSIAHDSEYDRHDKSANILEAIPPGSYVADAVGMEYKNWRQGDAIWLGLNCGCGKTSFFRSSLDYYRTFGYKVLYLGSREQLLNQTKLLVAKTLGSKYANYPSKYLTPVTDIDNFIFFETYQGIAETYRAGGKYRVDVFDGRKTVVFLDEIHWITSDAIFSSAPNCFLNGFFYQFQNALKIFMTATSWDCFEVISKILPPIPQEYIFSSNKKRRYIPFERVYISSDRKLDNVSAYYYGDTNHLVPKINQDKGKWLMLVSSKAEGEKLASEIDDSSFIFRESDRHFMDPEASAEKELISEEETFRNRVLITTSILDVGTNISDEGVVNIVVDTWDPVTLVQFVGRKRRKAEHINLYFHNRSASDVIKYLHDRITMTLIWLDLFIEGSGNIRYRERQRLCDLIGRDLLYYDKNNLTLNELGRLKFMNMQQYFQHILWETEIYGDKSFLAHQLELFGLSIDDCIDVNHDAIESTRAQLISYLDSCVDTDMDTDHYTKFCQRFDEFLSKLGKNTHRGGGKYQADKINKVLENNELKYKVSYEAGIYKITKI